MVHAIEAFTTKHKKNLYSDMLAKQALQLMSANLREAVHNGNNLAAREAMLIGAMLAGQAFANAPVAAVHALAYPLGGHYHIPHGLSNSLVLSPVLRFNASHAAPLYAQLLPCLDGHAIRHARVDVIEDCQAFILAMENLIDDVQLPKRLRDVQVLEKDLPMLAADVMLQQRLLVNNPRTVTEADALAIYRQVY
jgi:alcohol dehydrogenase class IV